jgi:multidrug efflux system outer membrane protein
MTYQLNRRAAAILDGALTAANISGKWRIRVTDLIANTFAPGERLPVIRSANLKITQAQYEEALAGYQKTVQGAFGEVSDALIAYQRTREFVARQELRTQSNREATDLANIRYDGGVTSYLEVLYNEQELFTAELNLAQARLNELLSVVQLYRALGGGWQTGNTLVQK